MKYLLLTLAFSALSVFAFANVKLPKIFGDGMVLQRDQQIVVWGWAAGGETVAVSFHNQKKTTKAGKDGRWKVLLQPEAAGGPYTLVVNGKNTTTVNDVLVGDVWICSGQSNMEWPVAASANAAAEIAAANFPMIRHFKVTNSTSGTPVDDLLHAGSWKQAVPENVGAFTAVGYFFARELHKQLGVPVGLINTSWGGTDVETWTSRDAFEGSAEFKNMIAAIGRINPDSAAQVRAKAILDNLKKLQPVLPDSNALTQWRTAGFDDSKWPRMALPQLWENAPLRDFDGVVWFRKTIDLPGNMAGSQAELHLAMIDDADETYLNGTKIGSTNGYNEKRIYKVPAGVLKAGRNVIAVRVNDTGGGGGIYGDSADLKLIITTTVIPLSGDWAFSIESVAGGNGGYTNPNSFPTLLYNAMIHPLVPFSMKGVIWYQGENNAVRAYQYRTAFPLLIQDWRRRWGHDFPFYFVQLASFNAGGGDSRKGSSWAELREAQTATLQLPHTGMAVTTDIGEAGDIHPKNKLDVGLRLAAVALHDAYGKGVVFSGPQYQSMKVDGGSALLTFNNGGSGLLARDKYGYLKGFEVAGADRHFYYAKAFVHDNRVVVQADEVTAPVAVRYAWADDAGEANLYNKEGFPAVPFRTDTWKGITETAKYRDAP